MVSLFAGKTAVHPLVIFSAFVVIPAAVWLVSSPPMSHARLNVGFIPMNGEGKYVVVNPTTANALDPVSLNKKPINAIATGLLTYKTSTRHLYFFEVNSMDGSVAMVEYDPMTKTEKFNTKFTSPQVIFAIEYDEKDNEIYGIGSSVDKKTMACWRWTGSSATTDGIWELKGNIVDFTDLVGVDGVSAFDKNKQKYYFITTAYNGLTFTLRELDIPTMKVTASFPLGSLRVTSMEFDPVANQLLAVVPAMPTSGYKTGRVVWIDVGAGTVTTQGMLPERRDPLLYTATFDTADQVLVVGVQESLDEQAAGVKVENFIFNNEQVNGAHVAPFATSGKAFGTTSGTAPFPMQSVLPHAAHPDKTRRQVNEDTILNLQGLYRVESPDPTDFYNTQLRVVITSTKKNWIWIDSGSAVGKNATLPPAANRTNQVILYGNSGYCNSALSHMYYQGSTHWNSETHGVDTVTITIQSQSYAKMQDNSKASDIWTTASAYGKVESTSSQEVWVKYVNDGPHFNNLVNQTEIKTKWNKYVFTNLNVSDVDVNEPRPIPNTEGTLNVDYILEFYVKAYHGTMQLASKEGLTFLIGGQRAQEIKIRGQLDAINGAIKGMFYQQDPSWDNTDTIQLYIDDLGNSGQGYPHLRENRNVTVTVKYKNVLVVSDTRFSGDGSKIYVDFYEATNRANMGVTRGTCTTLFDAPTLATFGTKVQCEWETERRLSVLFFAPTPGTQETAPTILPDQTIHLLGQNEGGVLAGKNGQTYNNLTDLPTTYPVQRPTNPVAPTAIINSVSQVDKCKGLILDALKSEGGGGRLFKKYLWGITPDSSNYAQIKPILDAVNQLPAAQATTVTIPASAMMQQGQFTFELTVTNFLDTVSPMTTRTVTKTSTGIPQVSFKPSTQKVFRPVTNTVFAVISKSECDDPSAALPKLSYRYTSVSVSKPNFGTFSPDPVSAITTNLLLPKNTLTPGFTYRVNLEVTVVGVTPAITTSQSMDIVVEYSPLQAIITGGSKTVGIREALTVAAGNSVDPDLAESQSSDFDYKWTCTVTAPTAQDCSTELKTAFKYDDIGDPAWSTLSGTTFAGQTDTVKSLFTVGHTYKITVEIRRRNADTSDKRTATESVLYQFVEANPLEVSIQRTGTDQSNEVAREVGCGFVVEVLSAGYAPGTATTTWTVTGSDGSTIDVNNSNLIETVRNGKIYTLVIKANVMVVNLSYTAKLKIDDFGPNGSQKSSITERTVTVRQPPFGGSFIVEALDPTTGSYKVCKNNCTAVALTTEGRLSEGGAWQDAKGNTNLKFTFFKQIRSGTTVVSNVAVGEEGTGGAQKVFYEALKTGQSMFVRVKVVDDIGATTFMEEAVTVTYTPPTTAAAVAKVLLDTTKSVTALAEGGQYSAGYDLLSSMMTTTFTEGSVAADMSEVQAKEVYLSLVTLDSNTPTTTITESALDQQVSAVNTFYSSSSKVQLGADVIDFSQKFVEKRVNSLDDNGGSMSVTTYESTLKLITSTNSAKNKPSNSAARVGFVLKVASKLVTANMVVGGQSLTLNYIEYKVTLKKLGKSDLGGDTTSIGGTNNRRRLLAITGNPTVAVPTTITNYASPASGWDSAVIQAFSIADPYSFSISSNKIASNVVRYGFFLGRTEIIVRGMAEPNLATYNIPVDTAACDGVSKCVYTCNQWDTTVEQWDSGSCITSTQPSSSSSFVQCQCTMLRDTAVFAKADTEESSDGLSNGAIAGIVVAGVVVCAILIVGVAYTIMRRQEVHNADQQLEADAAAGAAAGVGAATVPAVAPSATVSETEVVATSKATPSSSMLSRALESQPPVEETAVLGATAGATEGETDGKADATDADVEAAIDDMGSALAAPDAEADADIPASAEAVESAEAAAEADADVEDADVAEEETPTADAPVEEEAPVADEAVEEVRRVDEDDEDAEPAADV